MASNSLPKLIPFRRTLLRALGPSSSSISSSDRYSIIFNQQPSNTSPIEARRFSCSNLSCVGINSRFYASLREEAMGPASFDYSSVLQDDEYHKLANSTIHDLLEKFEEYGDSVEIDGYDVDYGNEVLTLKLGSLGTYVINKQSPNRQIWMSSPVSGPSRFDWDRSALAWIYRRTKENLFKVLETEVELLCGEPINLS